MNYKSSKLGRIALGVAIAITAGLVSIQSANASSLSSDFYGKGEHENLGSGHGGCGGSSSGDCITTNYSTSYYAYGTASTDQNITMDGDLSSRTLNVSIAYDNFALLDSAKLYVLAKDDATGSKADSTSGRNPDGLEYLDILTVEGSKVSVDAVEVDTSSWLFGFDVKKFVTGTHTSPLDFLVATLNLCVGQSDLIFQNARLDLKYHTVDCPQPPSPVPLPAAAWLFGSALFGFISLSNRRKV